jgi:hypothetical protein
MSKCIECVHASWVRTSSGRIKKSAPGRCLAPLPDHPVLLCASSRTSIIHKWAIWPEYDGRCDIFEAISSPENPS